MVFFHQVRCEPDGVRLELSGEIDLAVCDELGGLLTSVVAASPGITDLDVSGLTFLDCSGIGELIRAYVEAQERGRTLTISRPQGRVRRVLELSDDLDLLPPDLVVFVPANGDAGLTADQPDTWGRGRDIASSTVA